MTADLHAPAGVDLDQLTLPAVRGLVEPAIQRGATSLWTLADLRWDDLRPERLSDTDRSAVRFITYIEDHLPGYLGWLMRTFPVDGTDLAPSTVSIHREYFRFFVAWAYDEERHASGLTRYQETAELASPEQLSLELAEEGRKHFDLPYLEPLEVFTYTMLQEKATQLFYQRFRDAADEPVLCDLLRLMARDEARHFALYSRLVETYLRRDPRGAAPHLKEVLSTFRMPLSDTLKRYRSWSFSVADSVGYDHTEAYASLHRMITEFIDGRDDLDDLARLCGQVQTLP